MLGADRELVLLTGMATAILVFVVLTWYAALSGIAVWIVVIGALRMMAKDRPDDAAGLWAACRLSDELSADLVAVAEVLIAVVALRRFRNSGPSFADLVPYAGLVADGVILLKDGANGRLVLCRTGLGEFDQPGT